MSNGFWAGGHDAYLKGLREQFKQAKQALQDKIASSSDEGRRALEHEASELEREYKSKVRGSDDCIF